MKATGHPERLKRLLDVADRLERIRRHLERRSTSADQSDVQTLRDESRRCVRDLFKPDDGAATEPLPGILGRLLRRHEFDEEQTTILLLLINRRLGGDRYSLTAREILAFLFENSYDRLRGLRLFVRSAPLRRSGVIETVGVSRSARDPLDIEYSLSPRLFRSLQREAAPEISTLEAWVATPYEDHRSHLIDWGRLARFQQRRARVVFDADDPNVARASFDVRRLDSRIRRDRARIDARIALTPDVDEFPLLRFIERHLLDDDEQAILVSMLFQDVYAGASFIDAIEVVKLVAVDEEELISKRRLLSPDSPLVRRGIVQFSETDEGTDPPFAREVFLAPDVIAELLDNSSDLGPIDSDTRIEWHEFLDSLDDSGEFEIG